MVTDHQATFPGFQFPNTTQIPNEVFDTLMSRLSGGELKVLLYICRRTFGFRKDNDSISLSQISKGITTKAGRVLDQGTGLSKRHVINALKALEKQSIIKVSRTVDETGLHEVNTYSLNILDTESGVGTKSLQGVVNASSPEVVKFSSLGVVNSSAPTKQREQKKEEQKKDFDVDVIAQDLQNFGITQSAATQLTQHYPTVYIREKVAMAQGLVTAGSCLVSQNPAGWLRKAIEEDYSLPKSSARYRQRSGREKKHARRAQGELRAMPEVAGEQRMTKKQPQQAQNAPTERREPEKTSRENETVWNKALEQVKKDLPPFDTGETAARLTGTTLIEVTETAATIFVPNRFIIPWLERQLYSQIAKAMKTVIGKDLDLQFIAVS